MMDKERLKELRALVWADYECLTETGNHGGYHADLIALIDSALAEPSDADVAEAIEDFEKIKSNYMRTAKAFDGSRDPIYAEACKNIDSYALAIAALRQYQKPTDEAVQRAISWIESDKIDRQRDWDQQDHDWKSEPGAKEMHEDFMSAFELAIQGLRQMRTGPDCSTAEWQGGYCLGYGKSDTDDEPCDTCKACPKQANYDDDKCEWCDKILTLFTNSGKYMPENQPPRNYCTNCGRKLVKHDG